MAVHTNNNKTYYVNPAYLTFVENSGYGANLIQVSASSSCYLSVYDPSNGIGYSDADKNYQRWKVTAYNNKFPDNDKFYIYARLDRMSPSALIVYSKKELRVDGSALDGSEPASDLYYFIRLGEVSETDGTSIRRITYDTGYLESDQGKNDANELNEMWELDKYSSPWLIRAKEALDSFTLRGFLTFIGGFVFNKDGTEKPVIDLKRSMDSDFEYLYNEDGSLMLDEHGLPIPDETYVPISDDTIPTSKYVKTMNDDRYILKIRPDQTEFLVKFFDGIEAGLHTDGGIDGSKLHADGRAELGRLQVNSHSEFRGNLSSQEFISGFTAGKGWAIQMKEWLNAAGVTEHRSVAEFDDLIVRGTLRVFEFVISQMLGENDNRTFTAMLEVDHYDPETGRIWLNTHDGTFYNPFRRDDIIMVQQFNGMPSAENNYYVTKQYEFVVTDVGVGDMNLEEDRLDWLTFRNFTSPMEGATINLIQKGDTLVRIDNLTDPTRKGIIQMMTVGEDTPYMDIIYGRKTDPENALKGRFGNIQGIYNPLFGWLNEFGAYLTNLYAVGEFRIAHSGEDVSDAFEVTKGEFRTSYSQSTYDMTEEENFFTNAAMTNNCEHWILSEECTEFFAVEDIIEFFNYEPYVDEHSFAGMSEHKGRDMLRLYKGYIYQTNDLIKKPGVHKVYDPESTGAGYVDVPDTLYLSIRLYVASSGVFECGFASADGTFYDNIFHVTRELSAQEDAYDIRVSSTWDGVGDFWMRTDGDMYIDILTLTDDALENFKITTSTRIEQDAHHIALVGQKIDDNITDLRIELNSDLGRITARVSELEKATGDITTSGLVTEAKFATLFSQAVVDNKIVAQSELTTYVQKDGNGYISGARVSADVIDITATQIINIFSRDGVKITGEHIQIDGFISANKTFTIDKSGYMTCIGGTIGCFAISDKNLTATRNSGDGIESLILSPDGIIFADKYSKEQFGYTAAHAAAGLGYCIFSIVVNRNIPYSGNVGMMLSVSGVSVDPEGTGAVDTKGLYGNCALYIRDGHIAGFRMKTRRVNISQGLSTYDNNIICIHEEGEITLTLPSGCDDGHEYWFFTLKGCRVNLVATGATFTSTADASFTEKRWQLYKYDASNKVWLSSFMNK